MKRLPIIQDKKRFTQESLWEFEMNLKERLISLFRQEVPDQWCQVRLHLTGELPGNSSESLIKEIVGEAYSVQLSWLRQRIIDTLYRQESQRGGWALDIVFWGPAVFARETEHVLAEVRPQFAYIIDEREIKENGHKIHA